MSTEISNMNLEIREATTRYINITCKSKETGEDFDFTDFIAQTYLDFNGKQEYVPTVIAGNIVSYKIPAEVSVGAKKGIAETRIFKDNHSFDLYDVYEVLRIDIKVAKANKPDIAPLD